MHSMWILFGLAMIVGALLVRYVFWRLERDLADAARLAEDPEHRRKTLCELDAALDRHPRDVSLRRQRADLRRFEQDFAGVTEDLAALLEQTPDDDVAWGELAEAEMERARYPAAAAAARRALDLDPDYPDYARLLAAAALAGEDRETAAEALDRWELAEKAREREDRDRPAPRMIQGRRLPPYERDFRVGLYKAALDALEGRAEEGRRRLGALRKLDPDAVDDTLAADPALACFADVHSDPE